MHIKDIMTIGPATVGPDTTIAEAGRFMLDRRLSALPVIDREDRLLGIVTEGDLLRRPELGTEPTIGWWRGFLAPETSARDFVRTRGRHVGEVMTAAVETITTTTNLADAVALMERRRFKQLPVVQGAVLIGLLTRRDIIAALLDTLKMVEDTALSDDAIATMVRSTIVASKWAPKGMVTVAVKSGVVTLAGTVFSLAEREALQVIAENAAGARGLEDHMVVLDPVSGYAYGVV